MLIEVLGGKLAPDDKVCELFTSYGFKLRFFKDSDENNKDKALVFELPELSFEVPLFARGPEGNYTLTKELEKLFSANKDIKRIQLVRDAHCYEYMAFARYKDDDNELLMMLPSGVVYKIGSKVEVIARFTNLKNQKRTLKFNNTLFFMVKLNRIDLEDLFYISGEESEKTYVLELEPNETLEEKINFELPIKDVGVYKIQLYTTTFQEGKAQTFIMTEAIDIIVKQ